MHTHDFNYQNYSPSSDSSILLHSSSVKGSLCSTPNQSININPLMEKPIYNETNKITCGTYVNENYLDSSQTLDDAENYNPNHNSNDKANRFFSDGVVDVLSRWFQENESYPYPDEATTRQLALESNISAKQVRKWFANKRVRSNKCMKQSYRKRDQKPKIVSKLQMI
jgi:hypothetical protein